MGARAANFGRLVSTFHFEISLVEFTLAFDYRKFIQLRQHFTSPPMHHAECAALSRITASAALWINP